MSRVESQMVTRRLRHPKTVVDVVVEWFRDELYRGNLKPGDWLLSEDALAQSLGVGRTSLREALKVLMALGVIEVVRGKGTRVARSPGEKVLAPLAFGLILEENTSRDLFQLRRIIELGSLDLLVESATDDDLELIEAQALEFARLAETGASPRELAVADVAFHRTMLEATKNPLLALVGSTVFGLFQRTMERRLSMPDGPSRAAEDHRNLVRALRRRDLPLLRQVVEESLTVWSEAFLEGQQ